MAVVVGTSDIGRYNEYGEQTVVGGAVVKLNCLKLILYFVAATFCRPRISEAGLASVAGVGGRCVGLVLGRSSIALGTTVVTRTVGPTVFGRFVVVGGVIATAVLATTFFVATAVVAASLVCFFIRSEHRFGDCSLGFVGGKLGLKGLEFRVTALVAGS